MFIKKSRLVTLIASFLQSGTTNKRKTLNFFLKGYFYIVFNWELELERVRES